MLVTCSIGCTSHQSLILYIVAINIYNITRSNRGTGDPLHPLPESKGFDMILVVVDRFTKKAYFIPTNTTLTSNGVAMLFRDHIFREHGIPEKVISNRGPQFVSQFMKELYRVL